MANTTRSKGEQTKRRILEAAAKLFAERGFHETPTQEIARQAGITQQTLFRHFKGPAKNRILRMIFREGWGYFLQLAKDAVAKTVDPLECFREVLRGTIQYLIQNPSILKVMLVEERQNNDDLREFLITDEMKKFIDLLAGIYRRGQMEGVLDESYDPKLALYSGIGMVETLMDLQGSPSEYLGIPCTPQDVETILHVYIAGLTLPRGIVEEIMYNGRKFSLLSYGQTLGSYIDKIKTSTLTIEFLSKIRQLPESQWQEIERKIRKSEY